MNTVTIKKSDIYAYVVAQTSRVGRVTGDYAKIAASADNEEIMNLYLPPAITTAEAYLQRMLKSTNNLQLKDSSDSVTISFNGEGDYQQKMDGVIATHLRLYLANYVLSQWFLVHPEVKETGALYAEYADGYLKSVLSALEQRGTAVDVTYEPRLHDGCMTRAGVLRTDRDIIVDENGLPLVDEWGNIMMH